MTNTKISRVGAIAVGSTLLIAAVGCELGASAPASDDERVEAPAEVEVEAEPGVEPEAEVVQEEQVRREFTDTDRLEVPTEGHPSSGAPDAPVTLVYATSFTCPFCARSRVTLRQLQREYREQLRVVTRLRLIGPEARPPALAACAAHRQDRFHDYADLLWDRVALESGDFSQTQLTALAREAGLDVDRFLTDSASEECADWVTEGDEALLDLGLRGAPSWVINGRVVVGAQPIEVFREIIDEELGRPEAS